MKRMINTFIRKTCEAVSRDIQQSPVLEKMLLAQGMTAARHIREIQKVETLADVELRIFSQWGEDGIIEWLVHHNGPMPPSFIEFGVEDYTESNTRFLLMARNWRGLILDGSQGHIAKIKADAISWRHDLTAVSAFITRDNINGLISSARFSGDIGLLSVDIDGNDYWVWQAIEAVSPHIVVVEYNAVLGDLAALTIPYDPAFARGKAHFSHLYWGASITAFARLANAKGYSLLGTNAAGCNAFFVRNDRMARFAGRINDQRPRPSRLRDSRDEAGGMTFATGAGRRSVIAGCAFVNLDTGQTGPLAGVEPLYSSRWINVMAGAAPPAAAPAP